MSILKSELCKLFTGRNVLILLLLVAINPLLQLYMINMPNDDMYTLADYSRLYREVSACDPDEMLSLLEEKENDTTMYGEASLCRRVSREVAACLGYREYLGSIETKVEEIGIMHRFVDDDGYSLRNAEKTAEVYAKLTGIEPRVQDPMPLLNVTDNDFTDYLAIVMIFILSLSLVFREKNENQLRLLRTAPYGRKKLMAAKVVAMFLAVSAVLLSLYAVNAVVGRCVFGKMDLGSPIQSIFIYRQSPFRVSIGGCLAVWFAAKILSFFLLGSFFMLMCMLFDNIFFVFVSSAITVIVELLLYTKLSLTHFLSFLKYANITYGIETGDMFSDYVNLRMLGTPVNTFLLYWCMWVIATFVVVILVVNCLGSTHEKKGVAVKRRSFFGRFECHTSVFRHESFKMLFSGKCLLVLALFCLFTYVWNPAERVRFDSVDEVYYKDYTDRFSGPPDNEQRGKIEAEKAKFDRLYEDMNADYEQGKNVFYIENKYRDDLNRQNAFEMVTQHVAYLEGVDGGQLFFDKGYAILTDGNNYRNRDVEQAFVYILVLIALAFGIFGVDHRNSEERILRTTYLGRRRLAGVKCILGVTGTVIAFSLVYVVHMINVLRAYGTGGIDAPAASIEQLARVPQGVSLAWYLLIIMLMRLVGGLIAVAVVAALFRHSKNSIAVIISCVVFFLIPLALVALGMPNAQFILLNPLLLGNVF